MKQILIFLLLIPFVFAIEYTDIVGTSMNPLMYEGDIAIGIKYTNQTLKVGDIVKFNNTNHYTGHTIHRIIWTDGINYATKGDNSPEDLRYQTKESIEEIIVGVIWKNEYTRRIC